MSSRIHDSDGDNEPLALYKIRRRLSLDRTHRSTPAIISKLHVSRHQSDPSNRNISMNGSKLRPKDAQGGVLAPLIIADSSFHPFQNSLPRASKRSLSLVSPSRKTLVSNEALNNPRKSRTSGVMRVFNSKLSEYSPQPQVDVQTIPKPKVLQFSKTAY